MDLFLLSRLVSSLLEKEHRLSLKILQDGLELDRDALEGLLFELVEVRKTAVVKDDSILEWLESETDTLPIPATPPDPDGLPGQAPADTPATASPPLQSEAERRQITVMFCDLVDSTRLSTELDPEDLREIITAYQDTVRSAIAPYSGFIARYMGDGVLIYFGYPQAHEEDAERAVRAGLALVRSMAGLNRDIERKYRVSMSVRVGVTTGPVVIGDIVGEGAAEEAAVIGETPNLAARLQAEARPDQVIIGPLTYQITRRLFQFSDLGERSLKGISHPVGIWRVLGEIEQENYDVSGTTLEDSPMVGRQEELGLLVRAWETCKSGQGQVVLVQGEGGIGKSRLVKALREHIADHDCTWVTLRCSPFHANSALYPVISHLQRVVGWRPGDDSRTRLARLESALERQSLPLREILPLFAELLSLPLEESIYQPLDLTPKQKRDQTLDALLSWCFEEAEATPMVQVWDDLHWADPSTLELLGLYIEQSPTVPILNVLTYRPDFALPWGIHSHMTPITLNRLEYPEVEGLIAHRAGGKPIPDEVIEHIANKADGVPLYVEELTKTILESGILQEKEDRFELTGRLEDMQIPSSLQDSLMARLDRLPAVREVAQIASVLGREFAYEMLSEVVKLDETDLKNGLTRLVGDELLYQRGRGTRARFIFKHALIQDAAYGSLLKQTRLQYHLRVARLLEQKFPDLVQAHPELAAHHYTEAGELSKAVRYWGQAGEQARNQSAFLEAIAYLTRGTEILHEIPDSPDRARRELTLLIALGHANIVARGHGAVGAEAAYTRARALCERLGNVPELLPTLFGLWRFYVSVRPLGETLQIANQIGGLPEEARDSTRRVIASYAAGYTALCMGDPGEAKNSLAKGIATYSPDQRSEEIYRAAQDPGVACHGYMAMTQWLLGFPDQARHHANLSIELADSIDDAFSSAYALCFTGAMVREFLGKDIDPAVRRGLAIAEQGGFSLWIAFGRIQAANEAFEIDPSSSALDELAKCLDAVTALGVHINTPYFMSLLARAYKRSGNVEAGLDILARAQASIENREERWWEAEIHRQRGELLLAMSNANTTEALACFERAVEIAQAQTAKSLELRALTSLFLCMPKSAGGKDAMRRLGDCHAWFTEGFDTRDLRKVSELLKRRI